MRFKLVKKSTNRSLTTFHVHNERGDIIGSVGVAPEEADDLLRHWSGAADRGERQPPVANAKPMPLMGRMPRAMVLRGC